MSCAKCGGSDIYTRWHGNGAWHDTRKYGDSCYSEYGPERGKPRGEHLHRWCRTCGFDWTGPLTPAATQENET